MTLASPMSAAATGGEARRVTTVAGRARSAGQLPGLGLVALGELDAGLVDRGGGVGGRERWCSPRPSGRWWWPRPGPGRRRRWPPAPSPRPWPGPGRRWW